MERLEKVLNGKSKLVIDAVAKYHNGIELVTKGEELVTQASLELKHLLGEDIPKPLKIKPKTKKPVQAPKTNGKVKLRAVLTKKTPRNQIDVEAYVERATNFIKNNDWVSIGMIEKALGISREPLGRLMELLKKRGLVKKIIKEHNPKHQHIPKVFNQKLHYFEINRVV